MRHIYVGTSGFQYKNWANEFYPNNVKKKDWLRYYASQFNTVEINSSFYRLPEEKTFVRWANTVPGDFRFAIKGSRYLTHIRRLRDPREPIERLFKRAKFMGPKLGVVLWQFIERWPFDQERLQRLDAFCQELGRCKDSKNVPQAFELRHKSWFNEDLYQTLQTYDYALVVNQSSRWPLAGVSTSTWSYLRFHGPKELYSSGYSNKQLKDWAQKARGLTGSGDIFAYFNNDVYVDAPRNAQKLKEYLHGGTRMV